MHKLPRYALLLLMLLCTLPAPSFAQPAHVRLINQTAAPGGNGHTWATAYTHPQQALDEAASNPAITEIWVAAGIYVPTRAVDPTDPYTRTFLLQNNLALYGGFAGHELTLEERDWVTNESVLGGGGPGILDRVNHVVRAEGTDRSARVDGFTIRDGYADYYTPSSSPRGYGGGVHIAGSATVANCIIRDNYATNQGGGIWADGDPLFINCLIKNNFGTSTGGAVLRGDAVFDSCSFEGNDAGTTARIVYVQTGSPRFEYCTFLGDSNAPHAVVVRATPQSLFTDCVFENHSSPVDRELVVAGTFVRCTFRNNAAPLTGSHFEDCDIYLHSTPYYLFSASVIRRSRISQNEAQIGSNSSFENCVLLDNDASMNFPLLWHSTLVQCTISGNTGGANASRFIHDSVLSNSIVYDNSWSGLPTRYFDDTLVRNSLLDPNLPELGTNANFSANPLFADTDGRLAPTSPAIDAGDNTLVPASITTDLDGNPRFHDDPGMPNRGTPGGQGGSAIIDLGAYEFQAESCYANCDNSTAPPILNVDDFTCFINRFAAGDPYANCDASTIPPTLNVDDFMCFINRFAAGCP